MKIDNLTGVELAMCFGTSHVTISQLKKAGMPHKGGRFNLPACIQWRIARAGIEPNDDPAKDSGWLEEYRKQKAKTAKIERLRLKGDLVPASDAEAVIIEAVGAAKASFLALPRKLAARLIGLEPREIETELTEEIREILNRLANRKMPTEQKELQHDIDEAQDNLDPAPADRAQRLASSRKNDSKRVGREKPRPGRINKRRGGKVAK